MESEVTSYINKCRYCLKTLSDHIQHFSITTFDSSRFKDLMNSDLLPSDMLSSTICDGCQCEMLRFATFKKNLLENQQKLLELLESAGCAGQGQETGHEDPIKVETIESSDFVKEEQQQLVNDSDRPDNDSDRPNKTLEEYRARISRFKSTRRIFPAVDTSDFPCYECDETFSHESSLKTHRTTVHTPLEPDESSTKKFPRDLLFSPTTHNKHGKERHRPA